VIWLAATISGLELARHRRESIEPMPDVL
jgi:hypothetical protein